MDRKRLRNNNHPPPRFKMERGDVDEDCRVVTLVIHPTSDDAPVGTISGEYIDNPKRFKDLNSVWFFRRLLSNRDEDHPFRLNGYTYMSIEHVFQEEKYCLIHTDKQGCFSINGEFGKRHISDIMNMTGRSKLHLTDDQFDHWQSIQGRVQYEATHAQYDQHPFKMGVLKATKDAEIFMASNPMQKRIHFWWLEYVRDGKVPDWE